MAVSELVKDRAAELQDALSGVENIRVYTSPGADVEPPAAVLGPPALTWSTSSDEPTGARWVVYVVESAENERALENLLDLAPQVAAAIDDAFGNDAAVTRADPGVFRVGGKDLPAYEITVEVEL